MSTEWYCPKCGPIPDGDKYMCAVMWRCAKCNALIIEGIPAHVTKMQEEIAALRESLGLLQIGHDHKATLLASCEIALGERDEQIAVLQVERDRAREALIEEWTEDFYEGSVLCPAKGIANAEARYKSEIAQQSD